MPESRLNYLFILGAVWCILMGVALPLDRPVAQWVHDRAPINRDAPATHRVLAVVKLPGVFWTTLCIAGLLFLFHRRHGQAALALVLSGILVGAVYSVIKWAVGRHRPVRGIDPWNLHPFPQGIAGLWREQALCFPSGHASLSFATAASLGILLPRWRFLFFAVAAVVAAERVIENAHYLTDSVAGAGLGALTGWWVTRTILAAWPAPPARPSPPVRDRPANNS